MKQKGTHSRVEGGLICGPSCSNAGIFRYCPNGATEIKKKQMSEYDQEAYKKKYLQNQDLLLNPTQVVNCDCYYTKTDHSF